ncbi:unnamed protein product [Paramecium primaurelia]|uniref:Uncharacterized protein n=1 Tax=Paramecium primaurelia TaxID=5886 RepID=A0A8S1L6V0_PARPR|nr:unnamed protein product [Paramecium primaurelia]
MPKMRYFRFFYSKIIHGQVQEKLKTFLNKDLTMDLFMLKLEMLLNIQLIMIKIKMNTNYQQQIINNEYKQCYKQIQTKNNEQLDEYFKDKKCILYVDNVWFKSCYPLMKQDIITLEAEAKLIFTKGRDGRKNKFIKLQVYKF